MNCEIVDVEQNSEQWLDLRRGVITASKVNGLILKSGKLSDAQIESTAREIVSEEVSPDESMFSTYWTERGHEYEQDAIDIISSVAEKNFYFPGFAINKDKNIGCSPDALAKDHSCGAEVKCPKLTTQLKYLDAGELPREYLCQVHFSMYVTGIKVWFFCSYYPGAKPLVLKIEADTQMFKMFDDLVEKLQQRINYYKTFI